MARRGYSRLLPSSAATAADGTKAAAVAPGGGRWPQAAPQAAPQALSQAGRVAGGLVTLHVYSVTRLSALQRANGVLSSLGTGAYHAGVEVHGREWSFGATEDGSSGVFCCRPTECDDHTYLRAIPMGWTVACEAEVLVLIGRMRKEWSGDDYDLLHCNCCHFADELLRRLGVGRAPAWLTNLAGAGAAVSNQVVAAASGAAAARSAGQQAVARLHGALGDTTACPVAVDGDKSRSRCEDDLSVDVRSGCVAEVWRKAASAALGRASATCRGRAEQSHGSAISGNVSYAHCH